MNPHEIPREAGEDRLEKLEKRVERLEAALDLLREEQNQALRKKKEIERRSLLENLPLTALIVVLAVLAAQWVWHILGL